MGPALPLHCGGLLQGMVHDIDTAGRRQRQVAYSGFWLLATPAFRKPGTPSTSPSFSQLRKAATAVRRNSPPKKPAARATITNSESMVPAEQPPFFGQWADAKQGECATFCRHPMMPLSKWLARSGLSSMLPVRWRSARERIWQDSAFCDLLEHGTGRRLTWRGRAPSSDSISILDMGEAQQECLDCHRCCSCGIQ